MNILTLILIVIILFLGMGIIFLISRKSTKQLPDPQQDQSLQLLLQQMNELARRQEDLKSSVQEKLGENQREMSESLKYQTSRSHELIKEITREITEVKKTGEQVMGFTEQLKDLQNMLKNPKQRGILGEFYLETTLKNVLPPNAYQMQYLFPDGLKVDAVVFIRDKMIPIDSKFSLENYSRLREARDDAERDRFEKAFKSDLKLRIDETSKYIQPQNGTMDFAFMFIPHEAIYYDLLVAQIGGVKINTQDLIEYAFKKNVLIVSPTNFLAFLQTVLQGLKALQIEESAKEIQKRVAELGKHISTYEDYMKKLGGTLSTSVNHYNHAYRELGKIDKDVTRITGVSPEIEMIVLDKPNID